MAQWRVTSAMLMPFNLICLYYRNIGYAILFLVVPLLALAAWNCAKALRRNSEAQLSPTWKNLAVYGNPCQLSQQISGELQPNMVRKFGNLQVTPQWLVRRKMFST